ncbi:hypothetical protein P3T73_00210 [Kiritimatiellota bacterium B12222]|nr:hypothetical protein P3T73_00210 [Kiritimatiellota bacterium B12222]
MKFLQYFSTRRHPSDPKHRRHGSVLLLTLLVVSLLLVLTLGFTLMVRIQLKEQTLHHQRQQAEFIAKLALNLAINQLQITAGPDQRSTANATLGDGATGITAASTATNGLSTTQRGTRYWTGIWGNLNAPESLFTESPEPILLSWLVSGNHPSFRFSNNGQITSPLLAPILPFTPGMSVVEQSGGNALNSSTSPTTPLLIGTQAAALLLGPASAGDHADAYVAAPLENLTQDSERVGRFAWWVGDEGLKAKFNMVDPYIEHENPDDGNSTDSRDSRYRVQVAQRNGIERMAAFDDSSYPTATTDATSALYHGVERTISRSQIPLATPSLSPTDLQAHIHDLTPYSKGVIADSQFGGLRQDLSFHLDPRSGDTFLDGSNLIPDGSTPVSLINGSKPSPFSRSIAEGGLGYSTLDVSPRLGPKWDQVKSFYRIALEQPINLNVQPAVDIDADPVMVQAGISPVIVQVRTLFAMRAGPEIQTSLILVLGNPYTRPLQAPEGLDFWYSLNPLPVKNGNILGSEFGLVCDYQPPPTAADPNFVYLFTRNEGLNVVGNKQIRYYPILKFTGDYLPSDPDAGHPGVLDQVLFRIPAGELNIPPGQTIAFKISSGSPSSETIDGNSYTVVPLSEMTSTALTYYIHSCDPHYISTDPRIPAGIFSGAPIDPDASFQYGHNIPGDVGAMLNYTLSVSGKPHSVLQRLSSARLFSSLGNNNTGFEDRGLHTIYGPNSLFPPYTDGQVVGGIKTIRYFLDGSVGNGRYGGESYRAVHAESNLLGSYQKLRGLTDPADSSGSSNIKNIAPFWFLGNPHFLAEDLTNDLDPFSSRQYVWGASNDPARGTDFVISDIPAAYTPEELPLLSLAQLSHLDLTADDLALGVNEQTGMAIGNSRYDRFVPRDASHTEFIPNYWSLEYSNQNDSSSNAVGAIPNWYEGYVPDLPKQDEIRRYDISYLLNTALWDRYFLSTLRPASGIDSSWAPAPANSRLIYRDSSPLTLGQLRGSSATELIPDPSSLTLGENGRVPAAHLFIDGAFNVNSTSVEAWKALLSGLRGVGLGTAPAQSNLTPLPRSIRQPGLAQDLLSNSSSPSAPETFTGLRSLNDAQIDALSTEIVKQIRSRGPFLSLAQFVNRNLTPSNSYGDPVADTGLAGALQQAIDRSDINAPLNEDAYLEPAETKHNQLYPDNADMPTGDHSGLSQYMAAPGWLNQADVLQAIAPSLAARSDTFIIRSYGEMVDPNDASDTPRVLVRAWCEAVVQRVPDYLDDTERPTQLSSQLTGPNHFFGRRFRMVSFRWLSPNEI